MIWKALPSKGQPRFSTGLACCTRAGATAFRHPRVITPDDDYQTRVHVLSRPSSSFGQLLREITLAPVGVEVIGTNLRRIERPASGTKTTAVCSLHTDAGGSLAFANSEQRKRKQNTNEN